MQSDGTVAIGPGHRAELAKFLWSQSDFPFVASFVGSYIYKHLGYQLGQVSVRKRSKGRKKLANKWDSYAVDMLGAVCARSWARLIRTQLWSIDAFLLLLPLLASPPC